MTYDDIKAAELELKTAQQKVINTKLAYLKSNGIESEFDGETGKMVWKTKNNFKTDNVHDAAREVQSHLEFLRIRLGHRAMSEIRSKRPLLAFIQDAIPAGGQGGGCVIVDGEVSDVVVKVNNVWGFNLDRGTKCGLISSGDSGAYVLVSIVCDPE